MHADGWTGVFWDMDDFPLPPGLDVDQFVKNVELALWDKGVRGGDVVFYAYGVMVVRIPLIMNDTWLPSPSPQKKLSINLQGFIVCYMA